MITEDWWLWQHWIGLAKAARDAGYSVTIVTRVDAHGERIRECGFHLLDVDFARGRLSLWANLRALFLLKTVYHRIRPHLVHHFAMQPIILGSAAAALSGRPAVVNTIAGLGYVMTSRGVRARSLRCVLLPVLGRVLRRSHTIVQNPDDAALCRSLGGQPGRVAVIRGAGVDIRRFAVRPEPEGFVRVAMVSRLLWSKGVGEFARAASAVRAIREDVVFTLVGAPDERNPAAVPPERLSAWDADGIVGWWGYREDVADIWARSHVLPVPSVPTRLVFRAWRVATGAPYSPALPKRMNRDLTLGPASARAALGIMSRYSGLPVR